MNNANTNPSHSFTEGAEYDPSYSFAGGAEIQKWDHLRLLSPDYLKKKHFKHIAGTEYQLRIENGQMSALIISVDLVHPISCIVGLRNERDGKDSILPIDTEWQMDKIINALKGK